MKSEFLITIFACYDILEKIFSKFMYTEYIIKALLSREQRRIDDKVIE